MYIPFMIMAMFIQLVVLPVENAHAAERITPETTYGTLAMDVGAISYTNILFTSDAHTHQSYFSSMALRSHADISGHAARGRVVKSRTSAQSGITTLLFPPIYSLWVPSHPQGIDCISSFLRTFILQC